MKRISIALLFAMVFSTLTAFADEGLSIEQAKALAMKNSNLLKSAEIKVEGEEINAREELAKKNRQKNTSAPAGFGYISVVETTLLRRGYFSDLAAVSFELAKLSKEKLINTIEFSATSAYYSLYNARQAFDVKNEALRIANENLTSVNARYELGTASKLELSMAESTATLAELEIQTAKSAMELARLSFNNALGLDANESVVLTDSLTATPPETVDIEKSIQSALENRYEVKAAEFQVSLAEKEADCYEAFYTKGTYFYKLKLYNVESAKAMLENTKKDLALSVKKAYFDYLDSYTGVVASGEVAKTKQLMYDFAKSRFEAGQETNLEVVKALNELDSAKSAVVMAQTRYFLAKLAFESSLKVGLGN